MKKNIFVPVFNFNVNVETKLEKGIKFRISNFNYWIVTNVINTFIKADGVTDINEDVERKLTSIKEDIILDIYDDDIKQPLIEVEDYYIDDSYYFVSKEDYQKASQEWMNAMYEKYSCDITCRIKGDDVVILVTVNRN